MQGKERVDHGERTREKRKSEFVSEREFRPGRERDSVVNDEGESAAAPVTGRSLAGDDNGHDGETHGQTTTPTTGSLSVMQY